MDTENTSFLHPCRVIYSPQYIYVISEEPTIDCYGWGMRIDDSKGITPHSSFALTDLIRHPRDLVVVATDNELLHFEVLEHSGGGTTLTGGAAKLSEGFVKHCRKMEQQGTPVEWVKVEYHADGSDTFPKLHELYATVLPA